MLYFALQLCGLLLLTNGGVGPYFAGGNLLPWALLSIVGPMVVLLLDQSGSLSADCRRFWFVVSLSLVLVVGMFVRQLTVRQTDRVAGIHDGAVQAEIAADKLLHGENPYGANYRGTDYETLNPPIVGGPSVNVVWSHVIYPPFVFEAFLPFALLGRLDGVLADYRWLTVGALMLVAWLIIRRASTWEERTMGAVLTLGNPLLWMYAVIGTNDGLAVTLVVCSVALLGDRRWWWSGAIFALALATKQSVWILAPLWAWWTWREASGSARARRLAGFGLGAGLLITFGPFLLWQPQRLLTDIYTYASGSIPYSYPVSGTTFLQYLTIWHIIPSPWTVFPAYIFSLLVGLPALWMAWRRLRTRSGAGQWFIASAAVMLATLIVGRYMNANYLIFPTVLMVAGFVWPKNGNAHD